jgi:hypothetical protein
MANSTNPKPQTYTYEVEFTVRVIVRAFDRVEAANKARERLTDTPTRYVPKATLSDIRKANLQ